VTISRTERHNCHVGAELYIHEEASEMYSLLFRTAVHDVFSRVMLGLVFWFTPTRSTHHSITGASEKRRPALSAAAAAAMRLLQPWLLAGWVVRSTGCYHWLLAACQSIAWRGLRRPTLTSCDANTGSPRTCRLPAERLNCQVSTAPCARSNGFYDVVTVSQALRYWKYTLITQRCMWS